MKPWEETWAVETARNGVQGRAILTEREMVALFSGPDDAASQARAQLAAQAPAMVRLLLARLNTARADSFGVSPEVERLTNVLRAAGVLP